MSKTDKTYYIDSNRHVVVHLPVSGQVLKMRPPTAKDLSYIGAALENGIDGQPINDMEKAYYIAARLLTPTDDLKKDENAWRTYYDQLNSYDIDAEDTMEVANALTLFRSIGGTK